MALTNIVKRICEAPVRSNPADATDKTTRLCGKVQVEASRISFGQTKLITLECGHIVTEEPIVSTGYDELHKLGFREYQVDGVKFAENANARCLIADEQGLGKTWQALGLLSLHKQELLPAVIVCKTSLKLQLFHETMRLVGKDHLVQILNTGKDRALPGFSFYICTYDILKTDGLFELCPHIKTVILDEVQAIKNHLSERAKAVQKFTKDKEHIIALSGTPIKNNAGEYFTILNILQPQRFPSYVKFLEKYCDAYWGGYGPKVGGLSRPTEFREATDDFIIRRTRVEVAPELPIMDRQFFHVELDKKLNKAYASAMKELQTIMYSDEDDNTMTCILAVYTKLRQITGISKVTAAVDYATEFMESQPYNEKLVIFAHHHTAIDMLVANLNAWLKENEYGPCLNLHAGLSGDARQDLVNKFRDDDKCRIMVTSTLAAGEGLNLQFVNTSIMLERQWNPANEEQAEGRFIRLGRKDQTKGVVMVYMLASETIDEFFTEIVERKRAYVKSTLDGQEIMWDQNSLMKELANVLISKGREKWHL